MSLSADTAVFPPSSTRPSFFNDYSKTSLPGSSLFAFSSLTSLLSSLHLYFTSDPRAFFFKAHMLILLCYVYVLP